MHINSFITEQTRVLQLAGRLDALTASRLEFTLKRHLDAGDNHLILDMDQVPYISSAGLRVILLAAQSLNGEGSLTLAAPEPGVREVLECAGFHHILEITDTAPAEVHP